MNPLILLPVISAIAEIVPGIVKLFGGDNAGEVAETVINTAKNVLGTANAEEVKAKLAADEALREKFIKQLEADTERYRMQIADTQDARRTAVALVQAGSAIAWGPVIVSILITVGFFGVLFLLLYANVKFSELTGQVLLILVGTLGAQFTQVGNYWLGSSAGSAAKDMSLRSALSPVLPVARSSK